MTHCFVGLLGAGATGMGRVWALCFLCSTLPDIDGVIIRLAARLLDLRLTGIWWAHRGFSHSLLFALIIGLLAAVFVKQVLRFDKPFGLLVLYFFVVAASHGLIDAITSGGEGVMFFAPFHDGRYLFLYGPVPTLKARLWFGGQGLITFGKEVFWIWLPSIAFYAGFRLLKNKGRGRYLKPDRSGSLTPNL